MTDTLEDIVDFENILSQNDKDQLRLGLDKIAKMRRNISKAKRAGLDVRDMDTKLDEMESKISKLLAEL